MISPAIHVESKTRSSDAIKQRVILACARAARGVSRLMPVIYEGRIIAWLGWSLRENCAMWTMHHPWMHTLIDEDGLLCSFNSVDDLIYNTTQNGQMRQLWWFKWHGSTSTVSLWSHLYTLAGFPNAGVFNGAAFTARQHTDGEIGALMHGGNVSPKTKHVVSSFTRAEMTSVAVTETFVTVLYDMVTSYDQCNFGNTTATVNFTNTLPALRYTGAGDFGLQIMGCQHVATAGGLTYNALKYTSIGGIAGQTCPTTLVQPSSSGAPGVGAAPVTAFGQIDSSGGDSAILNAPLVNGDTGVTQLDSINYTGPNVGDVNDYILGYQLAWMPIYGGFDYTYAHDYVKQIPSLPRIRDGACLTLAMHFVGGSANKWHGGVNVAWA